MNEHTLRSNLEDNDITLEDVRHLCIEIIRKYQKTFSDLGKYDRGAMVPDESLN